jgi:hypothetical protein
MAKPGGDVLATTEARDRLSEILRSFERDGAAAEPVPFGSHRKPQGVILSWALWLELLPAIEDHLDTLEAVARLRRSGEERLAFDDVVRAFGRDPAEYP